MAAFETDLTSSAAARSETIRHRTRVRYRTNDLRVDWTESSGAVRSFKRRVTESLQQSWEGEAAEEENRGGEMQSNRRLTPLKGLPVVMRLRRMHHLLAPESAFE